MPSHRVVRRIHRAVPVADQMCLADTYRELVLRGNPGPPTCGSGHNEAAVTLAARA